MTTLSNEIIQQLQERKGRIVFYHPGLAEDIVDMTHADCYHANHEIETYDPEPKDLTGRVEIDFEYGSVMAEFHCPICGETEFHEDGEFLTDSYIDFKDNGDYAIGRYETYQVGEKEFWIRELVAIYLETARLPKLNPIDLFTHIESNLETRLTEEERQAVQATQHQS